MDDRPQRIQIVTDSPRQLAAELVLAEIARTVEIGDDSLVVETDDIERLRAQIAPITSAKQIRFTEMRPLDDDLESVFRYVVGTS